MELFEIQGVFCWCEEKEGLLISDPEPDFSG